MLILLSLGLFSFFTLSYHLYKTLLSLNRKRHCEAGASAPSHLGSCLLLYFYSKPLGIYGVEDWNNSECQSA